MARPSRNIDQLLIRAGLELLPETGVRALSIRQVAGRAGANLGMFHYHFKTKEAFVRMVLQQVYDGMFTNLTLEARRSESAMESLRAVLHVLARFGRDNRRLLVRLLGDALSGETVAIQFLQANLPRHVGVLKRLISRGQKDGTFKKVPPSQAMAFLAGSVAGPILLGSAAISSGFAPPQVAAGLESEVFSDMAISQRIDMALEGLAKSRTSPGASGDRK
jgi:AcrR family transcriptional regulator